MILVIVGLALAGLALNEGTKSNGKTQKGVDASVKAGIWAVLAIVAFMYATGVA